MRTQKQMYYLKSKLIMVLFALITFTACESKSNENNETVEAPEMDVIAATFIGDTRALKQHIAAKSDLNVKDPYGSTSLAIAATFGKTNIAKLLLEGGADPNLTNADGSTPLHTAAFFGRTEIVEALIANGADLTIRNNFGATALESISMPFEDVKLIYDQMGKDLGPLGLKLQYDKIKKARPVIAQIIQKAQ